MTHPSRRFHRLPAAGTLGTGSWARVAAGVATDDRRRRTGHPLTTGRARTPATTNVSLPVDVKVWRRYVTPSMTDSVTVHPVAVMGCVVSTLMVNFQFVVPRLAARVNVQSG